MVEREKSTVGKVRVTAESLPAPNLLLSQWIHSMVPFHYLHSPSPLSLMPCAIGSILWSLVDLVCHRSLDPFHGLLSIFFVTARGRMFAMRADTIFQSSHGTLRSRGAAMCRLPLRTNPPTGPGTERVGRIGHHSPSGEVCDPSRVQCSQTTRRWCGDIP